MCVSFAVKSFFAVNTLMAGAARWILQQPGESWLLCVVIKLMQDTIYIKLQLGDPGEHLVVIPKLF